MLKEKHGDQVKGQEFKGNHCFNPIAFQGTAIYRFTLEPGSCVLTIRSRSMKQA
jgi:hypothetical protein